MKKEHLLSTLLCSVALAGCATYDSPPLGSNPYGYTYDQIPSPVAPGPVILDQRPVVVLEKEPVAEFRETPFSGIAESSGSSDGQVVGAVGSTTIVDPSGASRPNGTAVRGPNGVPSGAAGSSGGAAASPSVGLIVDDDDNGVRTNLNTTNFITNTNFGGTNANFVNTNQFTNQPNAGLTNTNVGNQASRTNAPSIDEPAGTQLQTNRPFGEPPPPQFRTNSAIDEPAGVQFRGGNTNQTQTGAQQGSPNQPVGDSAFPFPDNRDRRVPLDNTTSPTGEAALQPQSGTAQQQQNQTQQQQQQQADQQQGQTTQPTPQQQQQRSQPSSGVSGPQ